MLSEIPQSVGAVREMFDSVYEADHPTLLTDFYTDLDAIEDAIKALIDKCLDFRPFHGYSPKRK